LTLCNPQSFTSSSLLGTVWAGLWKREKLTLGFGSF
jgi:hypothetical protein